MRAYKLPVGAGVVALRGLAPLLVVGALLTGCSLDGVWPFVTPTPSPAPPTPTAASRSAPLLAPTPSPTPTATPRPTATRAPAPTATPRATPTPHPTVTPTSTAPPASAPANPAPYAAHLIVRGKPETGVVGLSFDAGGRDGGQTGSVLDTLHRFGVHATFFLTGEWSEANSALVKRMAAEGNELANHTYDHPDLTKVSDQEILAQVARADQAVQKVAGVGLKRYVRPPFGAFDQRVLNVLGKQGYDVIYWTLDSGDWRAEMSAADVAQRVGTKANAGDVVVFHCYPAKTAQALPTALEGIKARGLRMGTVSQALGRPTEPHAPSPVPSPSPSPSPQAERGGL